MSDWRKEWFRCVFVPSSWNIIPTPQYNYAWTYEFKSTPATSIYIKQPVTPADKLEAWDAARGLIAFNPRLAFYSDQVARTKVLNKLSQKKWDIGVTALELRQTAGLVTDLAVGLTLQVESLINSRKNMRSKLNAFFRDVRRQGSFDKAAVNVGLTDINLLNDLRSRWMSYQFGVRPLLMDVDNAVTFLSDAIHQSNYSVLVRAKAGHESEEIRTVGPLGTVQSDVLSYARVRDKCTTHYSVVYELPTGHVTTRQALGLDNPGAIAWEVTRLSWMVDYAVGVGDWMQSFTASNGMIFREGCRSTLRKAEMLEMTTQPSAGGQIAQGLAMMAPGPKVRPALFERGLFTREVLDSGVIPAFVPQIKSELGLVQLANSLFAMSSVLGGKPGLR